MRYLRPAAVLSAALVVLTAPASSSATPAKAAAETKTFRLDVSDDPGWIGYAELTATKQPESKWHVHGTVHKVTKSKGCLAVDNDAASWIPGSSRFGKVCTSGASAEVNGTTTAEDKRIVLRWIINNAPDATSTYNL